MAKANGASTCSWPYFLIQLARGRNQALAPNNPLSIVRRSFPLFDLVWPLSQLYFWESPRGKAPSNASRDSTNQNTSFVERFSRSERAVFRGIRGEIYALFQACFGNFDTIPPWKVVGTLYLDSNFVTFKYFAFLSV